MFTAKKKNKKKLGASIYIYYRVKRKCAHPSPIFQMQHTSTLWCLSFQTSSSGHSIGQSICKCLLSIYSMPSTYVSGVVNKTDKLLGREVHSSNKHICNIHITYIGFAYYKVGYCKYSLIFIQFRESEKSPK